MKMGFCLPRHAVGGRGRGMDSCPVSGYGVTFLRRNDGMGVVAVYFQRNRSCRLPPTPPIMKMGFCLPRHAVGGRGRGMDSCLRRNDGCGGAAAIFRGMAEYGCAIRSEVDRLRRSHGQPVLGERLFQVVEVEVGVEGEGGEEVGDAGAGGFDGFGIGCGAGFAELSG